MPRKIKKLPDLATMGVACYPIYDERGVVCDIVTVSVAGDRGYSGVKGVLEGSALRMAYKMYKDLTDPKNDGLMIMVTDAGQFRGVFAKKASSLVDARGQPIYN